MLFPDGHLPSRRWLPFAWLCAAVLAFLAVAVRSSVRTPLLGSSEDHRHREPASSSRALAGLEIPDAVISISLLGLLVGSVASLVLRFRRSSGVERQQIKWVALAVACPGVLVRPVEVASAIGLNGELSTRS